MERENTIDRIDSHAHIMPPKRLRGLVRWVLKAFPRHPVSENITANDILKDFRNQGVTHFFNFIYPLQVEETDPLNAFNLDFCRQTPGAIPFASMHVETPDKVRTAETIISAHEIAGFKFHPFVQGFDPWDKRMSRLYSFLEEAGKPLFFHTGFEEFYGKQMPIGELEKLVRRYPSLTVVFVHMAFPSLSIAFKMLDDYPNLYLDATNVLAILRPEFQPFLVSSPQGEKLADILMSGLERYSHRIMFGSDHPVGMGGLDSIYQDMEKAPLSDAVKSNLTYTTAFNFISTFMPTYDWDISLLSPKT